MDAAVRGLVDNSEHVPFCNVPATGGCNAVIWQGWMNGWLDGWMNGWLDEWMAGWV